MMHPETELAWIDERRGRGVRAYRVIPKGTVVWLRDRFDLVLTAEEATAFPKAYREILDRWGYRDAAGRWILCSDHGRFVNHSCDPTLRSLGEDAMIAIRDIAAGGEITCDYGECNTELDDCSCGGPSCRGSVRRSDLLRWSASWYEDVSKAVEIAEQVPQPLLPFALERLRLEAWLNRLVPPPSLLELQAPAGLLRSIK